jgi:hypothetical protein
MQVLLIIAPISGIHDATLDMLAGIMPKHPMDMRNIFNFGIGSSLGGFNV